MGEYVTIGVGMVSFGSLTRRSRSRSFVSNWPNRPARSAIRTNTCRRRSRPWSVAGSRRRPPTRTNFRTGNLPGPRLAWPRSQPTVASYRGQW